MPMRRRLAGVRSMRTPSKLTAPRLGCRKPAMICSSVVLPQPEGPSRAINSPRATARSMLSSATVAPKLWPTPCSINAQPRASVRVSATLVVALLNMHGSPSRQRSASAVPVLLLTQAIVKTLKKIWRLKLAPIFVRYWRRNGRCLVKEAAMWLLSILRASAKRDDMIKTRGKADRVAQKTPARSKVRRRPAPRPESEPVDPRRMDDDPVVQGILTAISQKRRSEERRVG